jgi:predicted O-methyltransferase YrrM
MNILSSIRNNKNLPGSEMKNFLALLYVLAREMGSGGRIVELGTGPGESTRALMAGIPDGQTVYTIDSADRRFPVELGDFDKATFIRGDSVKTAEDFPPESVSLLFIDTSHDFPRTIAELKQWESRISPDGIICGHDYYLTLPNMNGVRPAVIEFLREGRENRWELQTFDDGHSGFFILWPKG